MKLTFYGGVCNEHVVHYIHCSFCNNFINMFFFLNILCQLINTLSRKSTVYFTPWPTFDGPKLFTYISRPYIMSLHFLSDVKLFGPHCDVKLFGRHWAF